MKFRHDIENFNDCVILVEGKEDVAAMKQIGFDRVYAIHVISVSLRERVEQICSSLDRNDTVCILTDFDKEGKKLYFCVQSILQEYGVRLDSRLRDILLKAGVSHMEGIDTFLRNLGSFIDTN